MESFLIISFGGILIGICCGTLSVIGDLFQVLKRYNTQLTNIESRLDKLEKSSVFNIKRLDNQLWRYLQIRERYGSYTLRKNPYISTI